MPSGRQQTVSNMLVHTLMQSWSHISYGREVVFWFSFFDKQQPQKAGQFMNADHEKTKIRVCDYIVRQCCFRIRRLFDWSIRIKDQWHTRAEFGGRMDAHIFRGL